MLIIPSILSTFTSLKDKTLKVVFETNEVTPEQMTSIAQNIQQFGYLAFKRESFSKDEEKKLAELESTYEPKNKSKSQQLRAVLYLNYNKNNKGFSTFDNYYNSEMIQITNHFKNKLD